MVDVDKLRGKIVERRMSVESVAIGIGINASTLYRRLNGGGGTFTIDEAEKIATALHLTANELNEIFFATSVARGANIDENEETHAHQNEQRPRYPS